MNKNTHNIDAFFEQLAAHYDEVMAGDDLTKSAPELAAALSEDQVARLSDDLLTSVDEND